MHPRIVLVIGFGNLGAKLLPLRWAFPFLRFEFIEQKPNHFREMRKMFQDVGTLGDLMRKGAAELPPNLRAFREALSRTPNFAPGAPENQALSMAELFEGHVRYGGDEKEGFSDDEFEELHTCYQGLIRELVEHDPSEVILYLATRPEDYLESLKRYAFFASSVAIDKPLAKTEHSLREIRRFVRVNPDLTVLPIDHYLFKLDFTRFMEQLERRGGLDSRAIQRLDVTICEKDLDESRLYFRETGIISDMMPHVAAMISLLLRRYPVTHAAVGNVIPFVHNYNIPQNQESDTSNSSTVKEGSAIVQAKMELNYWTGEGYIPASIRIAKGVENEERRKEIVITWHTGHRTTIDLQRKPDSSLPESPDAEATIGLPRKPDRRAGRIVSEEYVDWAGALRYLMNDGPLTEAMRSHFTFDRACQITSDVLTCQKQAEGKVPPSKDAMERLTFYRYPDIHLLPHRVFLFNFDGVVVNTEAAHTEAWQTWHKVIGHDGPELEKEVWFEPGKPNREMVSKALAHLYEKDETAASFSIQFGEKYYRLFAQILREEKLQKLETSFPGKPERASEYHQGVLTFLRLLRQFNQHLVLVTTNDALLVQQTLDQLLGPEKHEAPVGFDMYCVGKRNGLATYFETIESYRKKWGDGVEFLVIDDYLNALEALRQRYSSDEKKPNEGIVRLIHMDTMKKVRRREQRVGGIEHHDDFQDLIKEFSVSLRNERSLTSVG